MVWTVTSYGERGVGQALLPERSWHAVLIDHALGLAGIEQLGEVARLHATHRIVMFTPATRQELKPSAASAFTGRITAYTPGMFARVPVTSPAANAAGTMLFGPGSPSRHIEVRTGTQVVGVDGDTRLKIIGGEAIDIRLDR